jgi:hypothetical protein
MYRDNSRDRNGNQMQSPQEEEIQWVRAPRAVEPEPEKRIEKVNIYVDIYSYIHIKIYMC